MRRENVEGGKSEEVEVVTGVRVRIKWQVECGLELTLKCGLSWVRALVEWG